MEHQWNCSSVPLQHRLDPTLLEGRELDFDHLLKSSQMIKVIIGAGRISPEILDIGEKRPAPPSVVPVEEKVD